MNDQAMREAATTRAVNHPDRHKLTQRVHKPDVNEVVCNFCGRHWTVFPKNGVSQVGFIVAAANTHALTCQFATPEERWAILRLDTKRWKSNPPCNRIVTDETHEGFNLSPKEGQADG